MPMAQIPQPQPVWTGPPQNSGKAISSLVRGLVFFLGPLSAIAAVVGGQLALSDIKRSPGRLAGQGLAVGGLLPGDLALSVIPLLIIAAVAIPNLLRSRLVSNEASAMGFPAQLPHGASNLGRAVPLPSVAKVPWARLWQR